FSRVLFRSQQARQRAARACVREGVPDPLAQLQDGQDDAQAADGIGAAAWRAGGRRRFRAPRREERARPRLLPLTPPPLATGEDHHERAVKAAVYLARLRST